MLVSVVVLEVVSRGPEVVAVVVGTVVVSAVVDVLASVSVVSPLDPLESLDSRVMPDSPDSPDPLDSVMPASGHAASSTPASRHPRRMARVWHVRQAVGGWIAEGSTPSISTPCTTTA